MKHQLTHLSYLALFVSFSLFASEEVDEHIVVHADTPSYLYHLQDTLPVSTIEGSPLNSSLSIAEALTSAPEVTFNGQGGLLQTLSIRGLSRWRVQTLVEGIPIHSERRAGNTAEFIPPGLLGRAYLLPGAASTQLGSGALGGGIDLRLASSFDTQISAAYGVQQDYRDIQVLGGSEVANGDIHWGASYRHGNNSEAADNTSIFDGFEQSAGWVKYSSTTTPITDALFLVSTANNVGKASSDLPTERVTEYPSNDHWLAKLRFSWLNAQVYAHEFSLDTDVVRPEQRRNILSNSALSWGLNVSDSVSLLGLDVNWKAALDARSKVEAKEQEISNDGLVVFDRSNLDANQQAWSISADTLYQWQETAIAGGVRLEHLRQQDSSATPRKDSDTNSSIFLTAKHQWLSSLSTSFYLSSAFRAPVLTERYFNGSTPRGVTLGSPSLETEQGRNAQIDIDYRSDVIELGFSAARQWIDNYIERVSLSDELQQYINVGNVQIDSVNYVVAIPLTSRFNARFSGQWLWGEDDEGLAINDVSPHEHNVRLSYQGQNIETWLNTTYRQRHRRPGTSELPIGSAVYLQLGLSAAVSDSLSINIQVNNLTNRTYAVSTDDLSPLARGRDIQINGTYVF
ncbi:TonB-dependent receptor [Alteromonas sp. 5E99-2]|uniref:TonB-dependent receptor plug domain-containing protein n=1 Tax=Alteromonas sp. 5E99-2 TaxID=2817683 RepID=UPI001A98FA09|nr:TonB-dependent receptor plug domain-containing protein [Alteromonas sp. 5E99-2]MBO1256863.1 TonB-dependent receptor [Alteromonas sp. 5E99-2]